MPHTPHYIIGRVANLVLVSVVLLLAACSWQNPRDEIIENRAKQLLDDIADSVWAQALEKNPSLRLSAGLPIIEIPDITFQAAVERAALSRTTLKQLMKIPVESLAHEDWLTWDMLRSHLELEVEEVNYYWLQFPVTPYQGGALLGVIKSSANNAAVETPSQRQIYLGLISEYSKIINQMADKLEGQKSKGILIPSPAIPGIVELFRALRNSVGETFSLTENQLYGLDDRVEASFIKDIQHLVSVELTPSFDRLIGFLGPDYQKQAPKLVGLHQYPNGDQYYLHLVKKFTLPNETPKGLFDYGQRRVAEISAQMEAIRNQLGFHGTQSDFHRKLRADARFIAKSPEEIEQRYKQYIGRIEPLVPLYFTTQPKAPHGVKRLDRSREGGMAFGYYQSPTAENPVGLYRYNGSSLESRSQVGAGHVIYHELIPGHHFQYGIQRENTQIPRIRRELLSSSGFSEGWAEYGASLANEMGLLNDPYDQYGHLLFEMFLTVRLVVDPGMNYFGWSLQKARNYMDQHMFLSESEIASESLRYSTDLPGQALSYKIGHRTILKLRRRAEKELGDSFDIRMFHHEMLSYGSLGLDTLEKHIDVYINRQKKAK